MVSNHFLEKFLYQHSYASLLYSSRQTVLAEKNCRGIDKSEGSMEFRQKGFRHLNFDNVEILLQFGHCRNSDGEILFVRIPIYQSEQSSYSRN